MPITDLRVQNIGPFNDIKFHFDKNLNVFVGPNNSGKSTVLAALGDITVYPFNFPRKLLQKKRSSFTVTYKSNGPKTKQYSGQFPILTGPGSPKYWTNKRWDQWIRILVKLEYAMFVPALRQSTDFRAEGPLAKPEGRREGRQYDIAEGITTQERYGPGIAARIKASFGESAYLTKDENLIQKMIELDYRAYRKKDPSIRTLVDKIASATSEITSGYPIKFVGIGEDNTGLFPEFETPDGILPLNFLSQGTQSIIQTLAQVLISFAEYYGYSKNLLQQPGILIIDEIDAHLHPSWQRRFLPTLSTLFPNFQIFCSTHSPLVLGGLKAGQIHLLQRDSKQRVTTTTNESDISGWSADEVLRTILEVSAPTDLETENLLNRLQQLQNRQSLNRKEKLELNRLRKLVNEELLTGVAEAQYRKMEALLSSVGKQQDTRSSRGVKRKPASKARKTSNEKSSNTRRKK